MAVKEELLTFERDDYYGPNLKLTIDTGSLGGVSITISGGTGEIELKAAFLVWGDEVRKVIAQLSTWLARYEGRFGRKEAGGG